MKSTLILATPLRRFARGASTVAVTGGTLAEVLADADTRCPGLHEAIVADGELVPFVTALVGQAGIADAATLATPVPPGATVRLLSAVAGG